jgi:hypothetical protein
MLSILWYQWTAFFPLERVSIHHLLIKGLSGSMSAYLGVQVGRPEPEVPVATAVGARHLGKAARGNT